MSSTQYTLHTKPLNNQLQRLICISWLQVPRSVSCHAFVYLSRLSSFQGLKPRICFFLFLHFLFDCLIVEFSLIVSAMFLISIYMEIIKRFNERLWDARSCSHSDVKQHFDDCGGLGADFPTFYTLVSSCGL